MTLPTLQRRAAGIDVGSEQLFVAAAAVTHEIAASGFDAKIPNTCNAMDVPVINPSEKA